MTNPIRSAILPAACAALFTVTGGLPPAPAVARAAAAERQEAILVLEGMTCASCAFAVRAALRQLGGVDEAEVSYREKRATVVYDPARVTPEGLVAAVEKAGFRATLGPPTGP